MTHPEPVPARRAWPELHAAQRDVLREVLIHGPQSRVALAREVGLSRASLTRLAREMVELGFLEEGETRHAPTRGRPQELLRLRPDAAHFLGVKLTGDHLYAVVTDLASTVVAEHAERLESTAVEDVVARIAGVAGTLLASRELPAAVGVCLAGDVLERDGRVLVAHSRFLGWDGVPLAELLGRELGMPITVSNDVVALTNGHHWFGAGVGARSLVVFGLGAGIGSGVVVGGEVLVGAHGRSGRVGHARLDARGRTCARGHDDCVHAFVTMSAIEHNAGAASGGYRDALDRARAGDADALRAFRLAARALGVVVAEVVDVVDPELVLVTGEGVDMLELARDEFDRSLAESLEDVPLESVRVVRPDFDFAHYARGAAVTAIRSLF